MKPEFVKLNPQHVIPTIDDDGFILCESRPIMGYLVSKYAKNDSLYPKDPKKRGIVDQMLYFDAGSLHENMINCYVCILILLLDNNSLNNESHVVTEIKMPIISYETTGSPPCRLVRLAAAALGVTLNLKKISFENLEHLTPEYLKMNPQHMVPTIDDDGFIMCERNIIHVFISRAIITYLANQYGKDDSLYPKDPKKRALVDQRLYFDACTLYKAFIDYYYPIFIYKAPRDPTKYVAIGTALSFLEKFLEGQDYVAGKTMTLADLAIVVTVSTLEVSSYDLSKYKNVIRWFARIKSEAPKYEDNDVGAKVLKQWSEGVMKN
ncbi:hypothetical protein E2986_11895 [Frieseomelitta varia]|uniref:Uncharacterized protein n=1 Tax=Frieseomelitta varia TaxID=561572 RepID=A0A833RRS5_9HYME|nr:hypothetical protein E2986_11895 [Frieseomelitta varia]